MKLFSTIFIICSFVICGCRQKDETEQEFLNYLRLRHITPKENCAYIFIPSTQCVSCVRLNAASLSKAQNNSTFIFSNLTRKNFLNFKNYQYDKEDKVSGLKLAGFENTLVYYKYGHILFRMPLNIRQSAPRENCSREPG